MSFVVNICLLLICGPCYSVKNLLSNYFLKNLAGTSPPHPLLKFAGMGWGGEGMSRERGGDGEKNYNMWCEWERVLKYGVGMGTSFCPRVILYFGLV